MPDYRPARPLNSQAVLAADKALYTAHEGDARPNALFDAAGNRQRLDAADPGQECLRAEWIDQYGKNGGKVEEVPPKTGKRPGQAVQPCPLKKATLTVTVRYSPLEAPVKNATVKITGPVNRTLVTDASGRVVFPELPPGSYAVTADYTAKNPLVEHARSFSGNDNWAYDKARPPFPRDTNKCNLFVYEMMTGAGYVVPQKPHKKLYGLGPTVMLPPNAGDWASPSNTLLAKFPVVPSPEPGDIIAWSHAYSDATGHVGIVTYPLSSTPKTASLASGDSATVDLRMLRQSISESGNGVLEDTHTFWHYYDENNQREMGNIIFRRP